MKQVHKNCPLSQSSEVSKIDSFKKFSLMRCGNCSGRFAEEIPSDETLQKYYAQYAYQGESSISKITRSRYEDILKKLEKFRNQGRLLEIGCGRGEFLEIAREKGWEVNGTEFSSRALEILSEKNIPAHAGDISQMDTAKLFDAMKLLNRFLNH